jgi:hypothetical protein
MVLGVLRVLGGLVATAAMMAAWGAFLILIMVGVLYICRYIPLVGRRGRPRIAQPK